MKEVFYGTINGKEFNDLESFKEALSKINERDSYNVTFESKQVSDEHDRKGIYRVAREALQNKEKKFDPDSLRKYFHLDSLNGSNDDLTSIEDVHKFTEERFKKFIDQAPLLDPCTLSKTANLIERESQNVHDVSEANKEAIKNMEEKLKSMERKLTILRNAQDIVTTLEDYYEKVLNTTFDYLQ